MSMVSSVGLASDAMFVAALGAEDDRGAYRRWRASRLPRYFVLNCLVLPEPPAPDGVEAWGARFDAEFGPEAPVFSLAWDATGAPEASARALAAFHEAGYLGGGVVVTTASALPRPAVPGEAVVRPLTDDAAWADALAVSLAEIADETSEAYAREMLGAYRELVEAGLGRFACAYLGETPVGVAGIVTTGGLARLQWVSTLAPYRRRGVSRAIITDLAAWAVEQRGAKTLVAAAFDFAPEAVATYQGVGFTPTERLVRIWRFRSANTTPREA